MPRPITGANPYSKYKAIPIVIDGIRFHSKVEGDRYKDLKDWEKRGIITNLELQPRFPILHPESGKLICTYVGDFRYQRDGKTIIEDVKGPAGTETYAIKKKMMLMFNGIKVREIRRVRSRNKVITWSVDKQIEERP